MQINQLIIIPVILGYSEVSRKFVLLSTDNGVVFTISLSVDVVPRPKLFQYRSIQVGTRFDVPLFIDTSETDKHRFVTNLRWPVSKSTCHTGS